ESGPKIQFPTVVFRFVYPLWRSKETIKKLLTEIIPNEAEKDYQIKKERRRIEKMKIKQINGLNQLNDGMNIKQGLVDDYEDEDEDVMQNGSALGQAIFVAQEIMQFFPTSINIFTSTRPIDEKERLKDRANEGKGEKQGSNVIEKECQLLDCANQIYKEIASKMYEKSHCTNIFAFPPYSAASQFSYQQGYLDLSSLGIMPKFTGGIMQYYPHFGAHDPIQDTLRLRRDIFYTLVEREQGHDAVMCVRGSIGIKCRNFYGNGVVQGDNVTFFSSLSDGSSIGIELVLNDSFIGYGRGNEQKQDKNKKNEQKSSIQSKYEKLNIAPIDAGRQGSQSQTEVYVQIAVIFTNRQGIRKTRIHNIFLPIYPNPLDIFNSFDVVAGITYLAKKSGQELPSQDSIQKFLLHLRQPHIHSSLFLIINTTKAYLTDIPKNISCYQVQCIGL
ncbi:MAG: hypothetical protein EZS28_023966, partial [Streblomastix strix]